MHMELWDVYDVNRQRTGRVIDREKAFGQKGFGEEAYHLIVHVCVFNAEGQMLLQHRAPDKAYMPNRWDVSAGGSAVAGEDSRQAAEREIREELGLEISLRDVRPHFSINYTNGFDDFYAVELELRAEELRFPDGEVTEARWCSREEIRQMLADNRFMPYFPGVLELLFDTRDNYDGAIRSKARRNDAPPVDLNREV